MKKIKFYVQPRKKKYSLYKVVIHHKFAPAYNALGNRSVATTVEVWFDGVVCEGYSFCSTKDKFDWKYGAKIALEKALKKWNAIPKEDRCNIWKAFHDIVALYNISDYQEQADRWLISSMHKPGR